MNLLIKPALLSLVFSAIAFGTAVWRPLFNGVNFAGWHIAGATNYWTVDPVDSAFVGYSTTSTPYTMVFTDRADFDQYTVKYSYRLQAGCSGFFSRALELSGGALVEGMQVEAKFTGGTAGQSEVGSLYVHPSPGWVVQHPETYSDAIARANNQYQDVVLTVKRPFVYVNVNGFQTVGETNAAELTRGAGRAWNYTANTYVANPGKIGLQIHGGQALMDVRFKRIAILTGCGDSTSAGYDGTWVAGLPKQAAVYENNNTCNVTGIGSGTVEPSRYLGSIERVGAEWLFPVRTPGAHTLEIVTLNGQVIFSASHPSAKDYHIAVPARPGVYVAKVNTQSASVARKIVVQ